MMHAFRSLSVWTVFRAAALLMLLLGFIAGSAAGWIQLLMLGIFVAFLGIPHGAFDPFIAKSRGLWRTAPGLAAFIVVYVGLAIAVIALWILFPGVSLVVFLLISAWHFGADWSPNIVVRCGMGMIILGLPALAFGEETATIFRLLSGADAMPIQLWLMVLGVGAGIILIGFSVATSTGQRFIQAKRWDLLILILAGVVLPPLVYFIVYFCALHSPMHVGHSLGEIGDADRRPAVVWAIGLTIVTLMLAAVGYAVLMPFVSADAGLLQVVFVGLAALTVPHLALIDGAQPKPGAPN